jgi:iron-sulfur cluster repair protein YtfE (RIC family)
LHRPIDIVRCFHNAFRRDISEIDEAVLKVTRSGGDATPIFDRLHILGKILDYHAKGEEAAVFPAIDKLAPFVSQAYLFDHRELDKMVEGLETIRNAADLVIATRATAVLHTQVRIHLNKEDLYLYPILRDRTTDEEQIAIGRIMSSKIPQEKFSEFSQWMFPLLKFDDQVTVIRGWIAMMPPQVFAMARQLIKKNVIDNWAKLIEQIPQLTTQ